MPRQKCALRLQRSAFLRSLPAKIMLSLRGPQQNTKIQASTHGETDWESRRDASDKSCVLLCQHTASRKRMLTQK